MGDYPQHDEEQNRKLVEDMKNYPLVFLCSYWRMASL